MEVAFEKKLKSIPGRPGIAVGRSGSGSGTEASPGRLWRNERYAVGCHHHWDIYWLERKGIARRVIVKTKDGRMLQYSEEETSFVVVAWDAAWSGVCGLCGGVQLIPSRRFWTAVGLPNFFLVTVE
jgi:hypothetical protein